MARLLLVRRWKLSQRSIDIKLEPKSKTTFSKTQNVQSKNFEQSGSKKCQSKYEDTILTNTKNEQQGSAADKVEIRQTEIQTLIRGQVCKHQLFN